MEFEKKLIEILSDESFQRWIANKATGAEKGRWNAWLNADAHHPKLYEDAIELWNRSQFKAEPATMMDLDWIKLKPKLGVGRGDIPSSESHPLMNSRVQITKSKSTFFYLGCLVATLIAILVALKTPFIASIFTAPESTPVMTSIKTEFGQRQRLSLPDGSSIVMNGNSVIQYPKEWNTDTERNVEVSGEAYFNVVAGSNVKQRRFVVKTHDGWIRVLGTRFSVYERGHGTQVAVEEGSVQVATFDTSMTGTEELASLLLKPGHILHFHRGNSDLHSQLADLAFYTTWWQKRFRLANTAVWKIVQRIEETYDVQFIIDDDELLQRRITGSIQNQNIDTILEALATALQISIRRHGRIVTIGD